MPGEPTLLRVLITGRHWQKFETFEAQFERAAKELAASQGEPRLANVAVSRRQFERWYSGEARAWSALGDATESQRAIERATDLRESAATDDLDEVGGMCYFSRPRQLYYAADTSASLPARYSDTGVLLERAEQYATDAIGAYADAPVNEKSFGDEAGSRTDLAIARIRADDLDGAQEALQPVIGLPVSQRIINVHHAITEKSPDAPIARSMQEAIEEYCRTPAAALPR
jgi:hypothetical protein